MAAASIALLAVFALFFHSYFKVKITGRYEGLFLLRGRCGKLLELKDDLYLGDGHRLLFSLDFDRFKPKRARAEHLEPPYLYFEWDEADGSGFVRNFLPGGGRILTCFSRFAVFQDQDDLSGGTVVHGLFVGGGLPPNVKGDSLVKMNETGMAYNDGRRWYHLWCNVNEAIWPASAKKQIGPEMWKYLGSKVLNFSDRALAIRSVHEIDADGVPLVMERNAYFRAGNTYFILSVWITNAGDRPVTYYYTYGDEPWVGDFGSSKGNVGWVKDELIKYTQFIDTGKYSYAGFFDYGNDLVTGNHDFTWVANFIEWFGKRRPVVAFTNGQYDIPRQGAPEPLASNTRFMNIQWGPDTLAPGGKAVYVMAIGMAGNDPRNGFPVKPPINLKYIPGGDLHNSGRAETSCAQDDKPWKSR